MLMKRELHFVDGMHLATGTVGGVSPFITVAGGCTEACGSKFCNVLNVKMCTEGVGT